jgi:hypothetical protein
MKKDPHPEQAREESRQHQALPEINVILGGNSSEGETGNRKRKYRKQVLITSRLLNTWYELITFTLVDEEGVTFLIKVMLGLINLLLYPKCLQNIFVYCFFNMLKYKFINC